MFRPVAALVLALLCAHSCQDRVRAQTSAPPLAGALARLEAFPPPQRRVGFVSPLPISDTVPYMFYGTFRSRVMLIEQSLELRGYGTAAARAALGELDHVLSGIKSRGVEMIVIGGSVLSFAYPRAALLSRLEDASRKLGVPVTTDMGGSRTGDGARQRARARRGAALSGRRWHPVSRRQHDQLSLPRCRLLRSRQRRSFRPALLPA